MENIKHKFGERLKEIREDKGFSQTSLAKLFNCSVTCIGKWEKGTRNPSLVDLIKVARFFNVSTDYLLGVTDF